MHKPVPILWFRLMHEHHKTMDGFISISFLCKYQELISCQQPLGVHGVNDLFLEVVFFFSCTQHSRSTPGYSTRCLLCLLWPTCRPSGKDFLLAMCGCFRGTPGTPHLRVVILNCLSPPAAPAVGICYWPCPSVTVSPLGDTCFCGLAPASRSSASL